MTAFDPHLYNITIRKGVFDNEVSYEARAKEFPGISAFESSAQEAYEYVIDAIETLEVMHNEKGTPMPSPFAPEDDYSGRVTLRIPKSLHRQLAEAADDDGVSLNQYINSQLSYALGTRNSRSSLVNLFTGANDQVAKNISTKGRRLTKVTPIQNYRTTNDSTSLAG